MITEEALPYVPCLRQMPDIGSASQSLPPNCQLERLPEDLRYTVDGGRRGTFLQSPLNVLVKILSGKRNRSPVAEVAAHALKVANVLGATLTAEFKIAFQDTA